MALIIHPYILDNPTPTMWWRTVESDWIVSQTAIVKTASYQYQTASGQTLTGHKDTFIMSVGNDYAMSNQHKKAACANVRIIALYLIPRFHASALTEDEALAMGYSSLGSALEHIAKYCGPSESLVVFSFKLLNADRRGAK